MSTECQGIMAIMTAPSGDVIATAANFDRSGMGGCQLWEAQLYRARVALKYKAVRAYCSDAVVNSLSNYLFEQVADALCQKGGHKISYVAIGYSDDIAAEVKRKR